MSLDSLYGAAPIILDNFVASFHLLSRNANNLIIYVNPKIAPIRPFDYSYATKMVTLFLDKAYSNFDMKYAYNVNFENKASSSIKGKSKSKKLILTPNSGMLLDHISEFISSVISANPKFFMTQGIKTFPLRVDKRIFPQHDDLSYSGSLNNLGVPNFNTILNTTRIPGTMGIPSGLNFIDIRLDYLQFSNNVIDFG